MCSPELVKGLVQNLTRTDAASSPTVDANCRGEITADAMRWLKVGGCVRTLVGSGSEVGTRVWETQGVPRFKALRGGNTPSPAEWVDRLGGHDGYNGAPGAVWAEEEEGAGFPFSLSYECVCCYWIRPPCMEASWGVL